jgi:hypothetical protein
MELRLRLSALATPNTCPMHTESYDAQYEDRECADIQQCVDMVPTNTHCPSLIDPFRPRKIPDGWMVVPIPVCEAGEERRGG